MIQAVPSDAFRDAESASSWLAGQARDDAPALLTGLRTRIEAFNSLNVSPRERFKTLEVLREAAFAATNEYRRQCEGRPLPLPASERKTLETALGLWRDYAQGYRHCLESFDDDTALSSRVARVAHRVSSCLRMEQLTGYSGGIAPGPGFWKAFHDLFLAAEQLGCLGDTVEDRLLGETRDSSVRGQYAMALMLYLARPFHLSGAQLAAVVRWLARWREQARIGEQEDTGSKYLPVLLDLDADWPIHEGSGEARVPRWLSLDNVQRKIRGRRSALASGESPESLRLGGEFSAEDCAALLKTLGKRLKRTPPLLSAATETLPRRLVGIGFSAIFLLLGGKGLGEAPPEAEEWFLAHDGGDELVLLRPPADEASRLVLHDLLLAGWPDACQLATVSGLWQGEGGTLFCAATPLSNGVTPRVAEIRDWADGDVTRHPALQIVAEGDRMQDRLLLPAGVLARNSGVRFFDIGGQLLYELRVAECLERVGDVEFWRISGND
jgi:hypothetical protein